LRCARHCAARVVAASPRHCGFAASLHFALFVFMALRACGAMTRPRPQRRAERNDAAPRPQRRGLPAAMTREALLTRRAGAGIEKLSMNSNRSTSICIGPILVIT